MLQAANPNPNPPPPAPDADPTENLDPKEMPFVAKAPPKVKPQMHRDPMIELVKNIHKVPTDMNTAIQDQVKMIEEKAKEMLASKPYIETNKAAFHGHCNFDVFGNWRISISSASGIPGACRAFCQIVGSKGMSEIFPLQPLNESWTGCEVDLPFGEGSTDTFFIQTRQPVGDAMGMILAFDAMGPGMSLLNPWIVSCIEVEDMVKGITYNNTTAASESSQGEISFTVEEDNVSRLRVRLYEKDRKLTTWSQDKHKHTVMGPVLGLHGLDDEPLDIRGSYPLLLGVSVLFATINVDVSTDCVISFSIHDALLDPVTQGPTLVDAAVGRAYAKAIYKLGTLVVWRCNWELPWYHPRMCRYRMPDGRIFVFDIPNPSSCRIGYVSGSAEWWNPSTVTAGDMWSSVNWENDQSPFDFLIFGGKQIPASLVWQASASLRPFASQRDRIDNLRPSPQMAAEVESFIVSLYLCVWRQPKLSDLLGRVLTMMMWDEGDIYHEWGAGPCTPALGSIYQILARCFEIFQLQGVLSTPPSSESSKRLMKSFVSTPMHRGMDSRGPFSYVKKYGLVAFLALDLQSQRTPMRVFDASHLAQIRAKTVQIAVGCKYLFVMSSTPLGFIDIANADKHLGFVAVATGEVDRITQRAVNHWSHPSRQNDQLALFQLLTEISEKLECRVVVLSDGVGIGGCGVMYGSNGINLHQIITSGISAQVVPSWVRYCYRSMYTIPSPIGNSHGHVQNIPLHQTLTIARSEDTLFALGQCYAILGPKDGEYQATLLERVLDRDIKQLQAGAAEPNLKERVLSMPALQRLRNTEDLHKQRQLQQQKRKDEEKLAQSQDIRHAAWTYAWSIPVYTKQPYRAPTAMITANRVDATKTAATAEQLASQYYNLYTVPVLKEPVMTNDDRNVQWLSPGSVDAVARSLMRLDPFIVEASKEIDDLIRWTLSSRPTQKMAEPEIAVWKPQEEWLARVRQGLQKVSEPVAERPVRDGSGVANIPWEWQEMEQQPQPISMHQENHDVYDDPNYYY